MVAALDALGELDLLGGGQQIDLADVLQEELQRVGRELRSARLLDLLRRLLERSEEIGARLRVELVERRRLLVLFGDDRDRLFLVLDCRSLNLLGAHRLPSLP